jgi:uncharacterized membrane protein
MTKKNVLWLFDELPKLVGAGVLSDFEADRMREHYASEAKEPTLNLGLIVCAVLGSALIGLGVILLFAHNWEIFSREARTALSFAPLVIGQALLGWVLVRKRESVAWREGAALFLMAGVGSSIALIGQTYHIPGDMGSFLLTWMLLSVPLVYLADVSVVGAFYWIGLTAWAGFVQDEGGYAMLFWPLAALMGPYLWNWVRADPYGYRASFLGWVLSLCLCVATGIALEKFMPGLWIVVYCGLFAMLYLLGKYALDDSPSLWHRPLSVVGAAGSVVVSLILTFNELWKDVGWSHYRYGRYVNEWFALPDYVLCIGFLAAATILLVILIREKRFETVPFGVAGFVGFIGYMSVSAGAPPELGMVLFNLYLFALGGITLWTGIRTGQLTTLNGGMAILTALITARFFDSSLSFTARGIAFILIGAGFVAANLIVKRKGVVQ